MSHSRQEPIRAPVPAPFSFLRTSRISNFSHLYLKYSLQFSSIFRPAKASCLCSYCWSRHLSFYDRGRLGRVEYITSNIVFFPSTASHAKILANLISWVAVKSRIPSRNFAFFPSPALYFALMPDPENALPNHVNRGVRDLGTFLDKPSRITGIPVYAT